MQTILLVDDDSPIRGSLRQVLEGDGHRVLEAATAAEAREILTQEAVDLFLLDVFLGDESGLDLLRDIRQREPDACSVVISGESDIPTALEAIRIGAYDFLEKPVGRSKLRITVRNALAAVLRSQVTRDLRSAQLQRYTFTGSSAPLREVERVISRAASVNMPVLITGENGTGKEIVAHRVHLLSSRWVRPMLKLNCAAIPSALLESELFGFVKGAFTGATSDRQGVFAQAHESSLFLDEIGDMDVGLQAKLLRVLQEGEVTRIGETTPRPVDVRVVAATNRDIATQIKEGRLREDLYFRLAGIEIALPPLRERSGDIPLLVAEFMEAFCVENNRRRPSLHPAAMSKLMTHPFPGNVRELKNIVQRTLLLRDEDPIEEFLLPMRGARGEAEAGLVGPLAEVKRELMRRHLRVRLDAHGGKPKHLADELGVHVNNLYRMLKEHGLERDPG